MTDDVQTRLEALRREINFHNYRYHVLDAPVLSDAAYDRLLRELIELEREHPEWITPDSPSQRAGGPPSERFEKVAHPAPILSLANAMDVAELRAWYERTLKLTPAGASLAFVVEPKIDGLTVVLHYEAGRFVGGATRGDGEVGEDITANLRTVRSIPLHIPADPAAGAPPARLVVRGEAYMPLDQFQRFNKRQEEAGEQIFANPRNAAAGSLRQLDPTITASRPLSLLVYAVVAAEGLTVHTQWETLGTLRRLGFPVAADVARFEDFDAVAAHCLAWMERRDTLNYEADGLVVKLDDLGLASRLGVVGKDPRGAIAFKFPAREAATRLRDVGVNVGRTGTLNPYAMLEPVLLGGVTIKQATLHNYDDIARRDIRIGDMVIVRRAGDVIPQVIGPIKDLRRGDERPVSPPTHCPACGEPAVRPESEVAIYCENAGCPAQLVRRVEHFVSRDAMDIEGFGSRLSEVFVEQGLLHDVADLYALKAEDLLRLEGFADKSANKLLAAIAGSRRRPLARLLNALGIRGVGVVAAGDLARRFGSLDRLAAASEEELREIEGIGPVTAAGVVEYFSRPRHQALLAKLRAAGVQMQEEAAPTPTAQPLAGKSFVITGTLPGMSREAAKAMIEAAGGKVIGSVSAKTDYLVIGDAPGGTKFNAARTLGIPMIDEPALLRLIQGEGA